ncbi:MAG: hypothetical protein WBN93_10300, partial [Acidimicrobiia bacterium]
YQGIFGVYGAERPFIVDERCRLRGADLVALIRKVKIGTEDSIVNRRKTINSLFVNPITNRR